MTTNTPEDDYNEKDYSDEDFIGAYGVDDWDKEFEELDSLITKGDPNKDDHPEGIRDEYKDYRFAY